MHSTRRFGEQDEVRVRNLTFNVPIGDGAQWPSSSAPTLQPIRTTITIPHDLRAAAQGDDIARSLNYGSLSKAVVRSLDAHSPAGFASLEALLDHIFRTVFAAFEEVREVNVEIVKLRALPYAAGVGIMSTRIRDRERVGADVYFLSRLGVNLIVGLNQCEREDKQLVEFDIEVARASQQDDVFGFRSLGKVIREVTETSSFISLESLASLVAKTTLFHLGREEDVTTVRAAKPKAITFAEAAEVKLVRTLADYQDAVDESAAVDMHPLRIEALLAAYAPESAFETPHKAAIAFGANLGDRFANIEHALRMLEQPQDLVNVPHGTSAPLVHVVDTSFLYETAPMYVTDQPRFVNGACVIETNLSARTLLMLLKKIEEAVGRVPSIRNGPRAVDLDIMFYDSDVIDTRPETERDGLDNLQDQLVVPHPRMVEREFVLRPLSDMAPDFIHPVLKTSIQSLLAEVVRTQPAHTPAMYKAMPFPRYPKSSTSNETPTTQTYWKLPLSPLTGTFPSAGYKTRLMATLNVTPDSFSDGSLHNTPSGTLEYARTALAADAHIIDIGGYSTRPGAAFVPPADETARVTSAISTLRADTPDAVISVDTFRADVARAAVLAGANCINDVYALTGPAFPPTAASVPDLLEMRAVARELAVPVVLMHSRGEAGSNKDYAQYNYSKVGAVLEGVVLELGEKVDAIVRGRGGVRRWLVIVDPGIGFSKTIEGNLELLRDAALITGEFLPSSLSLPESLRRQNPLRGYPLLVGASRKSFLGNVLVQDDEEGGWRGRETHPQERDWATAAAIAGAVQQGAAVVRVHDVRGLGDVVRISNSIWR